MGVVLAKVSINGKFLVDAEANRTLLEGMLQPTEEPSPAIYQTILKQYAPKFSWAAPPTIQSATEREEEFKKICQEQFLSENEANRKLHRDGVSTMRGLESVESSVRDFKRKPLRLADNFSSARRLQPS